MRKPNGYGSIKKLSGCRRRPFVFVVSEGGKQKAVEYFCTQVEAEIFQADYNKVHYHKSLPGHKVTFAELYHRWLPAHIEQYGPSQSTIASYRNSYTHCRTLYDMPIDTIKYQHLQAIMDSMRKSGLSYSSCKKVRSLISLTSKYAIKMEYLSKNYADLLNLGRNKAVRPHKPFTRQKINRLWQQVDSPGVDAVLILLYTGMRVGELLALEKSSVNLRQRCIRITKSKTMSGLRLVPIHDKIYSLVAARMELPGSRLISDPDGRSYDYPRFCTVWDRVMRLIHATHTTHDCRHTVATLLDNAGANENAKRRLLGHATGDVTDRVYTHKGLRQLRRAIMLLK